MAEPENGGLNRSWEHSKHPLHRNLKPKAKPIKEMLG